MVVSGETGKGPKLKRRWEKADGLGPQGNKTLFIQKSGFRGICAWRHHRNHRK